MQILIMSAISFTAGAVPFGYIIAKYLYKMDITRKGSGNYGATNVYRVLGKAPGITTLALDILKGYLPVYVGIKISGGNLYPPCFYGILAILGHIFNPFFKLKGGKGVATALGVFAAITPMPIIIAVAAFIIVVYFTKYVSLGSITGAILFNISTFILYDSAVIKIFAAVTGLLILVKHISNIKRLVNGTENKLGASKK